MPDGQGHDTITVVISFAAAPAAIWYFGPIAIAGIAAFLFASLAFNPDLDLTSDAYACWGPFKLYWWLYQRLVPHRATISHGPIIGTVARLLYVSPLVVAVLAPFVAFKYLTVQKILVWAETNQSYLIAALIGLELNSLIHITADVISTKIKRTF